MIGIEARSDSEPLPDSGRVFGAATSEYHFEQALCLHLLALLGAKVEFHRASAFRARWLVRLQPEGQARPTRGVRQALRVQGGAV